MTQNSTHNEITSLAFYTETLRLIKFYLQTYLFNTSSESLQCFVNTHSTSAPQDGNSSSIEEKCIDVTHTDGPEPQRKAGKYQKLIFLEEIRVTILSLIPTIEKESREKLQHCHLYIHLVELLVDEHKSKYQKVNEFLNTNFVLNPDDLLGHAIRGNYGALAAIDPTLSSVLEEMNALGRSGLESKEIREIQKRHKVPSALMSIISGEFRDFKDTLEMDCYYLLHGISAECTSNILRVFDGDLGVLEAQTSSFVRLIFLLACPTADLRDLEKCFESLFHETFKIDNLIGLDFLAFSRKCQFYFPFLVETIPLNCVAVEALIRFASKNRLDKTPVIERFAHLLLDQKEYDQLCRFVLKNKIGGLRYTKEFMAYLAENYDRFRFFVPDEMAGDKAIQFASNLSRLAYVDGPTIRDMFRSEYFIWFVDVIVGSVSGRDDLGEDTILELMNMLFERERELSVSLRDHKHALTKKLLR